MGNINNPCVNRWGLNSFWNHYWYSDNKYHLFLQQDSLFLLLLKTYLKYGAETPMNFIKNLYWYKLTNRQNTNPMKLNHRWYTVLEEELGYSHSYIIRLETPEIFESQWTVLRFNKWIIITIQWFQPDKKKNKLLKQTRVKGHLFVTRPKPLLENKQRKLLVRSLSLLNAKLPHVLTNSTKYVF